MTGGSATVAVIHTSPFTLEPLKELLTELVPGVTVVNFLDDSILPQLARNGGDVSAVRGRLLDYARHAQTVGADVILSACSSVGDVAAAMREVVSVPVVRIDEGMADVAVSRGPRIGVAATLPTTLAPTLALLRAKAAAAGVDATFDARVADEAYALLSRGDRAGHDRELSAVLAGLAADNDVVVLAQASMARVLAALPEADRANFLTSPRLAAERVAQVLEGSRAKRG